MWVYCQEFLHGSLLTILIAPNVGTACKSVSRFIAERLEVVVSIGKDDLPSLPPAPPPACPALLPER